MGCNNIFSVAIECASNAVFGPAGEYIVFAFRFVAKRDWRAIIYVVFVWCGAVLVFTTVWINDDMDLVDRVMRRKFDIFRHRDAHLGRFGAVFERPMSEMIVFFSWSIEIDSRAFEIRIAKFGSAAIIITAVRINSERKVDRLPLCSERDWGCESELVFCGNTTDAHLPADETIMRACGLIHCYFGAIVVRG